MPPRQVGLGGAMGSTTPSTSADILAALAKTNSLFNAEVFAKRNFDALDEIYTADARILPPGAEMVSGREGIESFWSELIQSANATSAELYSDDIILAGDGAVEVGHEILTLAPTGPPAEQMHAKYVVYWREEAGDWKWHIDIWNINS